ncbi:MAG: universal stress protein [Cellulophaga sp.]|uniref:universal stress protein n=1 Tax=unclassified Cellulophaga TaxID=2634405 RepID=UPI0026E2F5DD|nr:MULTISPECIES: universal stress protein [unclassified Cellulophaga]MDO6491015.1 universal stress protein [Cellulophaga sp. 2_MG-2023]MDO6493791.1 universal stress protein [Cellulophaga sp. 3_MG-2023]
MKKIVIPTDFSETAMNAIMYAIHLFKHDISQITIIHAFADEVYKNTTTLDREDFEEYKNAYQQKIETALQKEVADILEASPNPKHKYTYVSCFGSLVDEINQIVEQQNADLVVMGTKGKTNNRNITFGSNTLQVIKYVECPVLAVPVAYHREYPKNILFPTDYMLAYKRRELKLLSTLAKNYSATVNFLYVSDFKPSSHRQLDNKMFLDATFKDNTCTNLKTSGTDITASINNTIAAEKIDMLVMVNRRHSYLENILYSSTIEEIGLQIKIPFLVLQNLSR